MIDVTSAGARPNTPEDCTAAFQHALNAHRHIYCPPGAYNLSGPLVLPDAACTISGAGMDVTTLRWHCEDGGIRGEFSYQPGRAVTVHDLTLATSVPAGGTALDLRFAQWESYPGTMGALERVLMRPDPCFGTGGYWDCGLLLTNAWQVKIASCTFYGNTDQPDASAVGFHVVGTSLEVHFAHCHASSCADGFVAHGPTQGIHLSHCGAAGVQYGVRALSGPPEPVTIITDSHFNAQVRGILLVNRPQSMIRGNVLYANQDGAYFGVELVGCHDSHVTDNTIISALVGNGIAIRDSDQVQVTGNLGRSVGTLVWLQQGSTHCVVQGNRNHAQPKGSVFDQGEGNSL